MTAGLSEWRNMNNLEIHLDNGLHKPMCYPGKDQFYRLTTKEDEATCKVCLVRNMLYNRYPPFFFKQLAYSFKYSEDFLNDSI